MAKSRDTGEGAEYSAHDIDDLSDAFEDAYDELDESDLESGTSHMRVTAQIEWAGTVDRKNNGMRTTRLDLPADGYREMRQAYLRARQAAGAERGKSYQAKGWRAQLRQLEGTKRGRGLMDDAGVSRSRETRRRWGLESGTHLAQNPGRRNQDAIQRAYNRLRETAAPSRGSRSAQRAFANQVTRTLRDRYGVNIRLRNIRSIHFD